MVIALVQSKAASAGIVTFDSVPTPGNRMLAWVTSVQTGLTGTTITNTGWTRIDSVSIGTTSGSTDGTLSLFTKIAGASEPQAINADSPGTAGHRMEVFEYSGANVSLTPATVKNSSLSANVTSLIAGSPSGITAAVGELLLAGWGFKSQSVGGFSVDSGFTPRFQSLRLTTEELLVGTAGTINPTLTWSTGSSHSGAIMVKLDLPPTGPPTNTVAPAVTGTAAVGSTLTTDNGSWDQTITSYTRKWQRDGVDLSGATATTYTLVAGDAGHTIRSVVSATSSNGTTSANSNGVAIPAAPVNTVAPAITTDGSPSTGETITVDTGTWVGTGLVYTYQWYRGASPISGETDWSYTLAVSDEGANISCRVTATNGGGATTANSNTIVPVVTSPIGDASFLTYLSGGTGNTDPALSIGGARGGTYSGSLNGLIGPILGSVAAAGGVFYSDLYIRNTHTISSCVLMKAYVLSQFPGGSGLTLAVAVPVEAANVTLPIRASITTPPPGVTWITATNYAAGGDYGTLTPGSWRGLHVRVTIAAGTDVTSEVDATWRVEGSIA